MSNHILETERAKFLVSRFPKLQSSEELFNLLSSKEDVEIYLEWVRPTMDKELFKLFRKTMGLGPQEGKSVTIEGIGEIDVSIAAIVTSLNLNGFKTLASCSGLLKDHPTWEERNRGYLSFLDEDGTREKIKKACEKLGLSCARGSTFFQPSIIVRFTGDSDEEIEDKWATFHVELLKLKQIGGKP